MNKTIYLARLIGLSCLAIGIACLVRGNTIIEATVANGPIMLVYAVICVTAGVAMILGHNIWSGGMLSVVVTLFGWAIFAKGLWLCFTPPETLMEMLGRMHYGDHFALYVAPSLILGVYLTWAGFLGRKS